jgi:hypothetical protein
MVILATKTANNFSLSLHQGFFTVLLVYALAMSLWGAFFYFRGSNPSGSYLSSLILAEGVAALQGLVGLVLLIQGHHPKDPLHYLYGVVAVVTLPAAYFLSDGGRTRRDSGIFALAAIFLVAIAIRGATTGSS